MKKRPFARAALQLGATIALVMPACVAANDALPQVPPAATPLPAASGWSLRLPADGKVSYRGVVGFDQAGAGGGSMLYPAPNAVGLLVAVLAHGAIVESAKIAQKEKMQADANVVLSPYQGAISNFELRELMRRARDKAAPVAAARLIEPTEDPGQDMVVHSVPTFSLTQDQKAIVLDNTIGIRLPGAAAAAAYQSTIRVVSSVKEVEDPLAYWTSNDGEKLKDESAQLVSESLAIALQDMRADAKAAPPSFRTVRYREGVAEKMERAQVIGTRCDRLLIRTLRGLLMSVPTATPGSNEDCATVATGAN